MTQLNKPVKRKLYITRAHLFIFAALVFVYMVLSHHLVGKTIQGWIFLYLVSAACLTGIWYYLYTRKNKTIP